MKNKKGFTLVELLAVIVILGVLLLIAVPAVTNIQRNVKRGTARDEALTFINAVKTCIMTEGDDAEAIKKCSGTGTTYNYVIEEYMDVKSVDDTETTNGKGLATITLVGTSSEDVTVTAFKYVSSQGFKIENGAGTPLTSNTGFFTLSGNTNLSGLKQALSSDAFITWK